MAWYWWVLIIIAVVLLGWLKLKVFKKITTAKKEKNKPIEED